MSTTIVFDEDDSFASVVDKYRAACAKVGVEDVAQSAGEDLIRSFHLDLRHSSAIGNSARLEKTIDGRQGSLRIVGITRAQRSQLSRLMSWLFR